MTWQLPGELADQLGRQAGVITRAHAVLGDVRTGVESILEHGYLYRVERPHALPNGVRQRRTRTGGVSRYKDVRYEEYMVIVELDGRGAHPEGER